MLQIKTFAFNPFSENTYILYNEHKNAIIIDPGCYNDNEKDVLKDWVTQQKLNVKFLINTHCHLDHVFGNKFVADTYNVKLHLHKLELPVFENAAIVGLRYEMPFVNYIGDLVFLEEDEIIQLDDDNLKVLFTPGHSPGSISLYCASQNFIISGDVLFFESVGRTDLPMCNFNDLQTSIQEQLYTLPAQTTVHSGHGHSTNIAHEIKNNPFVKGV